MKNRAQIAILALVNAVFLTQAVTNNTTNFDQEDIGRVRWILDTDHTEDLKMIARLYLAVMLTSVDPASNEAKELYQLVADYAQQRKNYAGNFGQIGALTHLFLGNLWDNKQHESDSFGPNQEAQDQARNNYLQAIALAEASFDAWGLANLILNKASIDLENNATFALYEHLPREDESKAIDSLLRSAVGELFHQQWQSSGQ